MRVFDPCRKLSVSPDHSLTISVSGTMAERPWQVGQLPVVGREAPPHPSGGRRQSRAGLLPRLGPGSGWVAGVRPAGWTRPPGPRPGGRE